MRKGCLLLLSVFALSACTFHPWGILSDDEDYDISELDFKSIQFDETLEDEERQDFLNVSYLLTKNVHIIKTLAQVEYNQYDRDDLEREHLDIQASNTFYENGVHQLDIRETTREDLYTTETQFIRNGYAYDYEYSCEYGDIDEDCYKKQAHGTNIWDNFEFTLVMLVQNVYEESDLLVGTSEDSVVGMINETYHNDEYEIHGNTVKMKRREQAVIYYEEYEGYYRISGLDYIYLKQVKYDFDKEKPSAEFHISELEKFHMVFDYETKTGIFDEEHLKKMMNVAK